MSNKEEFSNLLSELVMLWELLSENPFKIRALHNAIHFLQSTSMTLQEILQSPPKGFGKGILDRITEYLQTGTLNELQSLKSKFPTTLFELMKIPGLGPKKVKVLYDELRISTIEELQQACIQNKISTLKGFGEKTQQKILEGINFLNQYSGKYLYSDAEKMALSLIGDILLDDNIRSNVKIEVAGSLRRKKEIIHDIDLLVCGMHEYTKIAMQKFVSSPLVTKVLAEGDTKSSVLLNNGMQADLRIVAPESYATALCYFTGSKEHNTMLRSLALNKKLKLNEYGLYQNDTAVSLQSETELYEALGLHWIPPELREGLDEIEYASKDEIKNLITESDIVGVLHVHTTYSDGHSTLEEIVEYARKLGYEWLGISDHSQSAYYANGMKVDSLLKQWQEIDQLNQRYPDIKILKGIESDILPDGSLDYDESILKKFDFVIGSVHSHMSMNKEEMTNRIIKAIQNPHLTILGHPTGRLLLERPSYEVDIDVVLDACIKHNKIVEINANPHRLDLDWRVLRAYRNKGLQFIIGVDAHFIEGLEDMRYGVFVARKGWLSSDKLLNTRNYDELIKLLKPPK